MNKNNLFNFRMPQETREKLEAIAKKHKRKLSDMIRILIENEFEKEGK